jgi:hypothetical protein
MRLSLDYLLCYRIKRVQSNVDVWKSKKTSKNLDDYDVTYEGILHLLSCIGSSSRIYRAI